MKQRLLKITLFACGLAVLLWMVRAAGPELLWENLQQMQWALLGCVLIWAACYLLNAVSFGSIIGIYPLQRHMSRLELLRVTISGYAINYITPFGLLGGEPYRILVLKKYIGLEAATSSVLLYAMMHICSHFVFWLVGCVLAALLLSHTTGWLSALLIAIVCVCAVAILLFFVGYRSGMVVSLMHALARLPFVGRAVGRWSDRHADRLDEIDRGIVCLLKEHPRRFCFSLGVEFLSRMCSVLEIWLIVWQLGWHLSYSEAYLIVAFSSLFANLLFFSPLQMGTREGGICLVMQQLVPLGGLAALMPLAVSVSLATRIRETVWIFIGLVLAMVNASVTTSYTTRVTTK